MSHLKKKKTRLGKKQDLCLHTNFLKVEKLGLLVEPDPKRELLHQSYQLQQEAALFF